MEPIEEPTILPPTPTVPPPKGLSGTEDIRTSSDQKDHVAPRDQKNSTGQLYAIGAAAIVLILGALLAWTLRTRTRTLEEIQKQEAADLYPASQTPEEPSLLSTQGSKQ